MKFVRSILILLAISSQALSAQYLKEDTAITVQVGPFLDADDGKTPETINVNTLEGYLEVSKDNGAFAARNSTTDPTDDGDGWYLIPLSTTDTSTPGRLIVKAVHTATFQQVWVEFTVLPATVYDAWRGDGYLPVNAAQISGTTAGGVIATANVQESGQFGTGGDTGTTITLDGANAQSDFTGMELVITRADLGDIATRTIISNGGDGIVTLDATLSVVEDDIWRVYPGRHAGPATDTKVTSALADTNELQTDWANGGRLDNILDARSSQSSVDTIDGIVDSILSDTNELQTDWANGGRLDLILDTAAGGGSETTLNSGTSQGSSVVEGEELNTIILQSSGPSTVSDYYNQALVVITGGTGAGQSRTIYDYIGSSTKKAYVNRSWRTAPDNTSTYIILPQGIPQSNLTYWVGDATVGSAMSGAYNQTNFSSFWTNNSTISSATLNNLTDVHEQSIVETGSWLFNGLCVTTGGTTTNVILGGSGSPSSVNDFYKDYVATVYTGPAAKETRVITAYNGTTKALTVSPAFSTAPTDSSKIVIYPLRADMWDQITTGGSAPTAAENATAVWGNATRTLTDGASASAVATAVWATATRTLSTTGNTNVAAAVSSVWNGATVELTTGALDAIQARNEAALLATPEDDPEAGSVLDIMDKVHKAVRSR